MRTDLLFKRVTREQIHIILWDPQEDECVCFPDRSYVSCNWKRQDNNEHKSLQHSVKTLPRGSKW